MWASDKNTHQFSPLKQLEFEPKKANSTRQTYLSRPAEAVFPSPARKKAFRRLGQPTGKPSLWEKKTHAHAHGHTHTPSVAFQPERSGWQTTGPQPHHLKTVSDFGGPKSNRIGPLERWRARFPAQFLPHQGFGIRPGRVE